jgi:heme A synthase
MDTRKGREQGGAGLAFHPIWRHLTENGYFVQACHRVLSIGLWVATALTIVTTLLRNLPWGLASLLFGLFTLEGALGITTLQAGQPLVLSIVHQICAIAVLATALAPRDLGRSIRADIKLGAYVSTA